jgi:hypothetical protein
MYIISTAIRFCQLKIDTYRKCPSKPSQQCFDQIGAHQKDQYIFLVALRGFSIGCYSKNYIALQFVFSACGQIHLCETKLVSQNGHHMGISESYGKEIPNIYAIPEMFWSHLI